MASNAHTRRTMLGAIAAAPAITILPALANASPRSAWDAAYRDFQIKDALRRSADALAPRPAELEHRGARQSVVTKYGSESAALRSVEWNTTLADLYDASEKENAEIFRAFFMPANGAAIRLMMIPAPDAAAINVKTDIAQRYGLGEEELPADPFEIIKADAHRLAREIA